MMNMNKTIDKLLADYRLDRLTPKSLADSKAMIKTTDLCHLERAMSDQWMSELNTDLSDSGEERARSQRLFGKIAQQTRPPRSSAPLYKIVTIAASVLLPLLMLTSVYFYRQVEGVKNDQIIFMTGKGERASAKLPDGSTVNLNANSQLVYRQYEFNRKDRRMKFSGEGYFDITTNPAAPFVVETADLTVEVLGTKFNLKAVENSPIVEIFLEEGQVELTDVITQKRQLLKPSEKVSFDRTRRSFLITRTSSNESSSWRKGEMVFFGSPLREVLSAIENQYDVRITFNTSGVIENDKFTGTFTTRNLLEALNMIKHCYHTNYRVSGKEVIFE